MTATTSRTAAVLLSLGLVAGCSGDKPAPVAAPTGAMPSAVPSATPTPSPKATKAALLSPLTGLPVDKLRPVVAVKIDNAVLARPQRGLDQADVVYEEVVEGRMTRFLAIFSSNAVSDIGPVRSVRESDLPLLRAYGKVAFGFSGGNTGVVRKVRAAQVFDASYDQNPGAYTSAGRRADAYNFVPSYDRLLARAPLSAPAQDVGFRFGAVSKTGASSGKTVSVVWSRYAHTQWAWSPAQKAYVRSMDGRPAMLKDGKRQSAPNVLVQYVAVKNSQYRDVGGAASPYTTTTGTGKFTLLRDGKAISGTWKRNGVGATRYLDKSGKDVRLHTGPVWVMLVPNDTTARVS